MKGIPYYGGKTGKLNWLLPLLDIPVNQYIEPFAGGLSVLLARKPVTVEHCNDANGNIVNLWRQVQTNWQEVKREADGILYHPDYHAEAVRSHNANEEGPRAAALMIFNVYSSYSKIVNSTFTANMDRNICRNFRDFVESFPALAVRLADVQFQKQDIVKYMQAILDRKWVKTPLLIYADPPYLQAAAEYQEGMTEDQHRRFVEICVELGKREGYNLAISNYHNPIYDELLADWHCHEEKFYATAHNGPRTERTEVLWTNYLIQSSGLF